MTDWDDNAQPGQHQLELNKDERDLLDLAKQSFEKVVVVINASTTLELGDLQNDQGVDAILLAGSPGSTAFNALGRILNGEVNPSGRTVDLWAADFTADPTFVNFGNFLYDNVAPNYPVPVTESATSNATVTDEAPFVNYAEGIYVGYRYYETAAVEGFIDYDAAVVYPFGHGLSYTDFSWAVSNTELGDVDGTIAVTVDVTNTGAVAGRDVVQLYYSAPYTPGGVEKSAVVLGGFAKTGDIAPGATESVTIELAVEDMASYDYLDEKAYVLDAGDYVLSVREDSHTVAAGTQPIAYTVSEDVVYTGDDHRASDLEAVTNQFDDVSAQFTTTGEAGKIPVMSRADFAGTFPTAPTGDMLVADDAVADGFAVWDHEGAAEAFEGDMPTTGAGSDLSLIDMRGLAKDDPKWDELLDSLSVNDMTAMLLNGAYQTAAIGSIGKPQTLEPDGPAGFSSFINSAINGTAYPSEVLIRTDVGRRPRHGHGRHARQRGAVQGHQRLVRTRGQPAPLAVRRPQLRVLLGRPAAVRSDAHRRRERRRTKGVYTTIKHYAMNEQETNRVNNGIATWATEQAIREVYLKPFEIGIKNISMDVKYLSDHEGTVSETTIGAAGIMSSFNRIGATWAGGSVALMDTVLRGEWGFEGFAITDFNLYPYDEPQRGHPCRVRPDADLPAVEVVQRRQLRQGGRRHP